MFKILAGIILFCFGIYANKAGDVQTSNLSLFAGVSLIGAGLDTMFFTKK